MRIERVPDRATVWHQFMIRNEMMITVHPPYSPDPTPSDFYLFEHVKGVLRRESFETGDQVVLAVEGILRRIFLNNFCLACLGIVSHWHADAALVYFASFRLSALRPPSFPIHRAHLSKHGTVTRRVCFGSARKNGS
jgi:hypothetical protein